MNKFMTLKQGSNWIICSILIFGMLASCNSPKSKAVQLDPIYQFDGSNKLDKSIPNIASDSYQIIVTLKDEDESTDFNYSASSPPMPFNIGGWALIKKSQEDFFLFNSENNQGTNLKLNKGTIHEIKIVANSQENKTYFSLDGNVFSVKPYFVKIKTFATLGKGYQERYWKGSLYACSVKNLSKNTVLLELTE